MFQWICFSYILLAKLSHGELAVGDGGAHGPAAVIMPSWLRKSDTPRFKGVAATMMLNTPRYQRRYSTMIQNVLLNIPRDWGVQIFNIGEVESLDLNPGFAHLIERYPDRIMLTTIPPDIAKLNARARDLWSNEWMWENMHISADHDDTATGESNVLLFTGKGVICSNSHTTINDILDARLDYIGTKTINNKGLGGDGSTHSLRNRNAMIDAIRYQKKKGKKYDGNKESEDMFLLTSLLEMNNDDKYKKKHYRIATKEQTVQFGGKMSPAISIMTGDEWTNATMKKEAEDAGPPFIISGTIPYLGNAARELVLDMCPELKVLFPSVHNKHCFGPKHQGEQCAESICALKKNQTGGCDHDGNL